MSSQWSVSISFWLIVVLFPISLPGITQMAQNQIHDNQDQLLTDAIRGLGSNDETERNTARTTLLGKGQAAIPPLLDLLHSLIPTMEFCPPGSSIPCQTGRRLVTSPKTQLRAEVIALLGQLRAVAAVPILIKLLGFYDTEGAGIRYWGPERDALTEIGSAAVPQLLDNLRLAEEIRQSLYMSDGSVAGYLEIEIRILDILGRIGDERALEFLRKIKASNTNPYFHSSLKEAEERIKEKARQR